LSTILFGTTRLGGRFIFVLLSILSLYFVYRLVEELFGNKQALLVLVLLTFSQFHIGVSRLADNDTMLLFFTSLAMYIFFKAIHTNKGRWIYLLALTLGVGYLAKAAIILLIPIFFIFLISEKKYKHWLRRKEIYIGSCLCVIIILPHLCMAYEHTYEDVTRIGFSARFFYFYFGEIFAWFAEITNLFMWDFSGETSIFLLNPVNGRVFVSHVSSEFPFMNWVMGILIFISFFYCLRKGGRGNELIKFSLIMFFVVFIITTIISTRNSLMDEHWWADITIFPGIFMLVNMLAELAAKYKILNICIAALLFYCAINAIDFLHKQDNLYAIPKAYQKEILLSYRDEEELLCNTTQ